MNALQEPQVRGRLGAYPGSGFTVTIPLNETVARERVGLMMPSRGRLKVDERSQVSFIGPETRAVVLMMTFFNPSTSLFVTARSLVEVSSSGAYYPSLTFQ
jgi:hypothetical protein